VERLEPAAISLQFMGEKLKATREVHTDLQDLGGMPSCWCLTGRIGCMKLAAFPSPTKKRRYHK
jgi:hypothetical protein